MATTRETHASRLQCTLLSQTYSSRDMNRLQLRIVFAPLSQVSWEQSSWSCCYYSTILIILIYFSPSSRPSLCSLLIAIIKVYIYNISVVVGSSCGLCVPLPTTRQQLVLASLERRSIHFPAQFTGTRASIAREASRLNNSIKTCIKVNETYPCTWCARRRRVKEPKHAQVLDDASGTCSELTLLAAGLQPPRCDPCLCGVVGGLGWVVGSRLRDSRFNVMSVGGIVCGERVEDEWNGKDWMRGCRMSMRSVNIERRSFCSLCPLVFLTTRTTTMHRRGHQLSADVPCWLSVSAGARARHLRFGAHRRVNALHNINTYTIHTIAFGG